LVYDEVPPDCDSLGDLNKLVIAPGLLGGTSMPCSGRLSIGAKSPLTGGIKESNAGGTSAIWLARAGIKALVLEGRSEQGSIFVLVIEGEKVVFEDASRYRMLGNYSLAAALRREYGEDIAIISIGPAGEMGLSAACVSNLDREGRPSRVNGRGGLGAVMGSKGVKAIVIKKSKAENYSAQQRESFRGYVKEIARTIQEHPATGTFAEYGTAVLVKTTNALGCLPTRNFSSGSFAGAENISGETLRDLILTRGGKGETTHACMPGCIIRCSNVMPGPDGEELVAPLEFETIGLMGSNCGIDKLDEIAHLNYLANDLGVDSIETGAALGVAMEGGVLAWGDAAAASQILSGIYSNEVLGRVIGCGATVTGKVLGVTRVPAVKGQSFPAYDPRAIKGMGVTFATSPMGADHTAGSTLRAMVDHLKPEGQVQASLKAQVNLLVLDLLGLCMFTASSLFANPELLANAVGAYCDRVITFGDLQCLAGDILRLERKFNAAAGITGNKLPEYMRTEALPPQLAVFDVPQEQLDDIFMELDRQEEAIS
jgi:aldehyde:ferredoxin oxidoreductase